MDVKCWQTQKRHEQRIMTTEMDYQQTAAWIFHLGRVWGWMEILWRTYEINNYYCMAM